MKSIIIALKYEEPEWKQTFDCLSRCKVPIIVTSRDGIGNMAKAYNKGFFENIEIVKKYKYVWFVSNITFEGNMLKELEHGMEVSGFSAIHPSFKSDHKHMCPQRDNVVREVPFLEFTAPIVKTKVFEKFPLDENMPYMGHDLDWGYRVKKEGHRMGVHHGVEAKHTYIRFNKNLSTVTDIRKRLRKLWDEHTEYVLTQKYGENWKSKLHYL